MQVGQQRDVAVAAQAGVSHDDVFGDVQDVQRGAEGTGKRPSVRERDVRRFAKIGGDEDLLQVNHDVLPESGFSLRPWYRCQRSISSSSARMR